MWKIPIALLFALALFSCQKISSRNTGKAGLEPRQKITVAYTFQPQSTLVHVAAAKGYFAEEGLDLQPMMHTHGKTALFSVIENEADFATVAETPVMFSVLKGDQICVIANIEASTTNNAVVARNDTGITRPGDLKGKRIGVTPGTTGDFFLDSLLTVNGLTRKEVQVVTLKPEEMREAILTKKVEAISTWNYPLTQIKRQLGHAGTIFYDREIYTETFNIAARQDFVRDHPETVKRFLRALVKAESFVAQNQAEAESIMSAATNIDKNLINEVWKAFNYRVQLDQALLITLEDETRWAMKNGLTDQSVMPDYLKHIHLDSLRAVKPEAIKISR